MGLEKKLSPLLTRPVDRIGLTPIGDYSYAPTRTALANTHLRGSVNAGFAPD